MTPLLPLLDIDNPIFRTILKEEHPELLDTLTEKSPRGYHLIYHIADSDKNIIQGKRWQGIDLLWKNYVITAPTEGYQVIEHQPIKILSLIDYLKLCTFFDKHLGIIEEAQNIKQSRRHDTCETLTQSSKVIDYEKLELEKIIAAKQGSSSKIFDTSYFIDKTVLISVYNQKRKRLERNESLFQTTLYARDRGISPGEVEEILHDVFMLDTYGKPYQSDKSRLSEMKRTINSAYLRPARPLQESFRVPSLTDNTREKLFQAKMTYVVRVLEALYQAGYKAGDKITRKEAEQLLKGIIGRDSIHKALDSVFPLSAPIPLNTNVAIKEVQRQTNKCVFVRVKKPVKTYNGVAIGGRPEYQYTMPSREEVAQLVGADDSTYSTLLTQFDLESAKNTRKKLHFSLIDRRPARYDLIWLADRLGVTETTIKTYSRELEIFSTLQFDETPISRWNIDFIFDDLPDRFGVFILDINGKKYPPLVGIAQKLLTKRVNCSLMIQRANYYSTRKPEIAPNLRPTVQRQATKPTVKTPRKDAPKRQKLPALDVPEIPLSKPNEEITEGELILTLLQQEMNAVYNEKIKETWDGITGIKPLRNHVPLPEKRVIVTHTIKNNIAGISERSIKRLIGLYGFKRVLFVSDVVSKRKNVGNPAGLLTTILKSEEVAKRILL